MLRRRADEFLTGIRVEVTTEVPDNGACHRSRAFAEALGESVKHPKINPAYRRRMGNASDSTGLSMPSGPMRVCMPARPSVQKSTRRGCMTI
ncbi:hypothetical protein BSP239C_04036 [Brevibacterium sp. 239c]|nr:hypothetical protein BSP239C_04036 [Brevibacterium sp. 239c]